MIVRATRPKADPGEVDGILTEVLAANLVDQDGLIEPDRLAEFIKANRGIQDG